MTDNSKIYTWLGLYFGGLNCLAIILTALGIFYASIIAGYVILAGGFLAYIILKNGGKIKISREIILIGALSLLATIIFSQFTTPTVFSGRDQGSFSNAAIILSENHALKHSFPAEKEFFKIYGTGAALNFPGFNYDSTGNLVTAFPLGYTSWLAVFHSFFNLSGFAIANGVAFFIFLCSFYICARFFLKSIPSFIALILILTSFIFSWFLKFTLGENLALALTWFGLSQFLFFMKKADKLYLFASLFSFGLLIFTRIEALAIIATAIIAILVISKNKPAVAKIISRRNIFFTGLGIFLVFTLSLIINRPTYIALAKGFLNAFSSGGSAEQSSFSIAGFFYIFRVFSAYALFPYLALGIISILYFLKKKKYNLLLPFLILSPTFIYLINPSISLDHPWMLRRYLFAIIPTAIFLTVAFLDYFLKKRIYFFTAIAALFLANSILFVIYLPARQNKNLLPQIEEISKNFQNDDLVLIDRSAIGDPWSMMAGPMNLLFEKQAVYFFNPNDIKKIDLGAFNKTYLIIPDKNFEFYEKSCLAKNLIPVKDYKIENQALEIPSARKSDLLKNPIMLPQYQTTYVYGKIYLFEKS